MHFIFQNKYYKFEGVYSQLRFQEYFPSSSLRNLNYIKFNKKKTYIDQKKQTQICKVLRFLSTNFLILKLLHDNLIINVASYISFKILIR